MDLNRYEEKLELLRKMCDQSFISFGPSGAVKYRVPSQTFPIPNDFLDLTVFLQRQRSFGQTRAKHIHCGDTMHSAILIAAAIRLFTPSVVYEIGRYRSWSTSQMAFALKDARGEDGEKAKFISIDPHVGAKGGAGWKEDQCGGLNEWNISQDNIEKCGMSPYVTLVKAYSQDYIKHVNDGIELIFIDGDHRYEAAKRDIAQYGEKVVTNGLVILHDVWGEKFTGANFGPSRAYAEADPEKFEKIGITWDVGVLRRK